MSKITPQFLFDTICAHLSKRDDIWHIVNGPRRETWFTAETIAALSRAGPASVSAGCRVYGEEPFTRIAKTLKTFSVPVPVKSAGISGRGRGDLSVLENCIASPTSITLTIAEVKLIRPDSTKRDRGRGPKSGAGGGCDPDVDFLCDDLETQVRTLGNTRKCDGLLDQLDRAKLLFPNAQVYGLVFAVHRTGQCKQAQSRRFFEDVTGSISGVFASSCWSLWDGKVNAICGLQGVRPLGGMFTSLASTGLGILASNTPAASIKEVSGGG